MLIDFHTHVFPDKLAGQALGKLAEESGGSPPFAEGTLAGLKRQMAADGVDLSVVLSIATNPKQQTNVNNFAMELDRQAGIVAFGSVHPDAPNALEELERIREAGLKGVKFHPDFQGFYANAEKMRLIYRKISELGLITVFHAGLDIGYMAPYHGMPEHLLGALKWLDVPVVAAHWGGYACWTEVLEKLCGTELYLDVSLGSGLVPRPLAQAIADRHGPDRLLFGSDMPWRRPADEVRFLEHLDLSREDREKIYSGNALRLLGL